MIKSCSHHGFSPQRQVHIFYGGVSSHNRTSLDVACGGNIMLKPLADAIKIIEDMWSNPYNNLGDKTIMKRGVYQVEKDDYQTKFIKHMQASTLKIDTPLFPTCDRCWIVHGLWECTVDDKLVVAMDETLLGEKNILSSNTPTISIKYKASGKVKGCIGLKP